MSSTANWSYTAKATIWPLEEQDEWGGIQYGPPVVIDCDYGSRSRRQNGAQVAEIIVKLYVWTEYSQAKMGDMLAIGEHNSANPVAEADPVVFVGRDADTFERVADDYEIATGGA